MGAGMVAVSGMTDLAFAACALTELAANIPFLRLPIVVEGAAITGS